MEQKDALKLRIAELEAQLAEADKFGFQNRQLVSDNLDLKAQLAEANARIKFLQVNLPFIKECGQTLADAIRAEIIASGEHNE